MGSSERRERILARLEGSDRPFTGTELADLFGVTRQVIVQDIAVLRAKGHAIVATPQGYFSSKRFPPGSSRKVYRVMTIHHTPDRTEEELLTLVDNGVEVVDVAVDHAIYGEFVANLMFRSRREVLHFVRRVQEAGAPLLLTLAAGVHRHTLAAEDHRVIAAAMAELVAKGFDVLDGYSGTESELESEHEED